MGRLQPGGRCVVRGHYPGKLCPLLHDPVWDVADACALNQLYARHRRLAWYLSLKRKMAWIGVLHRCVPIPARGDEHENQAIPVRVHADRSRTDREYRMQLDGSTEQHHAVTILGYADHLGAVVHGSRRDVQPRSVLPSTQRVYRTADV